MKRTITIGFVLSLIIAGFSSSNVVSANEIKATEYHDHPICSECTELLDVDIQPKAIICPSCGGTSRTEKTEGPWTDFPKPCTHYPYGDDKYQEQTIYTDYICSKCNRHLDGPFTSTRTRFVKCFGHY